jgi:hypothetical protein
MTQQKLYSEKRYWYHLSSTLKKKKERLSPRDNDEGFNRTSFEPNTRRICVSPTLEQCLAAIPYGKHDTYTIYRTSKKVRAKPPRDVFDSHLTQEGWFSSPTVFVRVGVLDFEKILTPKGTRQKIISQAASLGFPDMSLKVYKWWLKVDPWKFVNSA